jgi:hypothetical protein
MSKWGNESAALVGFEITVPAPVPDEREQQASEQSSGGGQEDTWYRTLRVMSGSSEAAGVERTGALGETPRSQPQPSAEPEAQSKPEPSQPTTLAPSVASPPASQDASESGYVAPQKSADSYEDSWYQILRSRQAAGEAD